MWTCTIHGLIPVYVRRHHVATSIVLKTAFRYTRLNGFFWQFLSTPCLSVTINMASVLRAHDFEESQFTQVMESCLSRMLKNPDWSKERVLSIHHTGFGKSLIFNCFLVSWVLNVRSLKVDVNHNRGFSVSFRYRTTKKNWILGCSNRNWWRMRGGQRDSKNAKLSS